MFKTTALDNVGNAYVDKHVPTSTPGTRLEADDRNIVQDELVAAVENSGQTLDPAGVKRSQVSRAMFLNGVGAQSMVDSGSANAKVLTPVTGASGYIMGENYTQLSGAVFMFKNLAINTGAVTVDIGQTAGTLLGVKSLTLSDGTALTGGELFAGNYNLISYNLTNDRFELIIIENPTVSRGHIDGLIMSNNAVDSDYDIDVSIGEAADSAGNYLMKLISGMTKQIDAAWAVGTNAGGMFTGVVAASTWYHFFMIRKDSDGSIDFGFDTSVTASNRPAGYSNYQRIGSVFIGSPGLETIIGFTQDGDEFLWKDPPLDVDVVDQGTTAVTRTLSVATGTKVHAIINVAVAGPSATFVYLSSLDVNDEAPSQVAAPLASIMEEGAITMSHGPKIIRTNTSGQIRSRGDEAAITLRIATLGWIDSRGKNT